MTISGTVWLLAMYFAGTNVELFNVHLATLEDCLRVGEQAMTINVSPMLLEASCTEVRVEGILL